MRRIRTRTQRRWPSTSTDSQSMLLQAGGRVGVCHALGPRGIRLHAEAGPKRRQEFELLRIAYFHAFHIAPRRVDRQCLIKSHALKDQRPVLGLNKALDTLVEEGRPTQEGFTAMAPSVASNIVTKNGAGVSPVLPELKPGSVRWVRGREKFRQVHRRGHSQPQYSAIRFRSDGYRDFNMTQQNQAVGDVRYKTFDQGGAFFNIAVDDLRPLRTGQGTLHPDPSSVTSTSI